MRKDQAFAYPGFVNPPLTRQLAVPVAPGLPRRHFLISSAASGIACTLGCKPQPQAEPTAAVRTDVPLRVLLCGTDAWADAIATAWGGIAEQPLSIEVIEPSAAAGSRSTAAGSEPQQDFGRRVAEQMTRSDVAIVPAALLPTLSAAAALTPLAPALLDDPDLAADRFLPLLRDWAMRWAGSDVAIPLGSPQPALLIAGETDADALELPKSWEQFIRVAGQLQAAAKPAGGEAVVAEPLAGGAAAKMFLWRASAAAPDRWLFDRETLQPVLGDEVYVRTLQTMRSCAKLYGDRRMTAGEVWNGIAGGRLKMAIAWPGTSGDPPRVDALADTLVAPLPRGDAQASSGQAAAVMPDPDSPVGLISSRCRQTAAAKRFLIWLSGGDGSDMVRAAAPAMTVLRSASASAPAPVATAASDYDTYLAERLSSLQLRPTLRLHGYDRYLAALDQQVLACLDGKSSAAEALAATSDAWQALTREVGEQAQAQAWRQAQGLRN